MIIWRFDLVSQIRQALWRCRVGRVFESHHRFLVGLEDSSHPTQSLRNHVLPYANSYHRTQSVLLLPVIIVFFLFFSTLLFLTGLSPIL
jgi:hypothetical protein